MPWQRTSIPAGRRDHGRRRDAAPRATPPTPSTTTYALTPIGRATGVTVEVTTEVRPFHELGQRYATELRPGNVNVNGTIEPRAHQRRAAAS